MTDKHDKLVEIAMAAGFHVGSYADGRRCIGDLDGNDITEKLAAYRSAILADTAKDVKPVAWRFRWNQQGDWHITSHEPRGGDGTNKEPLYSASTVAALKAERDAALARVAVLEKDAARYRWLRQEHERFDPICHLTWKAGGNRNSSEWVNTAVLDSSIDAALTKGQP